MTPSSEVLEYVRLYLRAGWTTVPIPRGRKGPVERGWELRTHSHATENLLVDRYENIGVLLGEPSNDTGDVDLDCKEAIDLAPYFLPPTLTFGRASKPASHYLYYVTGGDERKSLQFKETKKKMLLEFRFSGLQTVFPGSYRAPQYDAKQRLLPGEPSAPELIEFTRDAPPMARISFAELQARCSALCAAVLLVRAWPEGGRHDAALALAGALIQSGWDHDATLGFVSAVCGQDAKRANMVAHSIEVHERGERLTGWGTLAKAVGSAVVYQVQELLRVPENTRDDTRQVIYEPEKLYEAAQIAEQALGETELYQQGGRLVQVAYGDPIPGLDTDSGTMAIRSAHEIHVAAEIGRRITYRATTGRPLPVPERVIKELLSQPTFPHARTLRGISTSPVPLPDGRVLGASGYDATSGIFIKLDGTYEMNITPNEALKVIDYAIQDFQFAKPIGRTALYAAALTPILRHAYEGPTPLFLFDAPTAGAGKGKLSKFCCVAAMGKDAPFGPFSGNEEERRKTISAGVFSGARVIRFDNVSIQLGGDSLTAMLTADDWEDRILGQTEKRTVKNRTIFHVTANNCSIGPDMHRRIVHIRIAPKEERPELRTNLAEPNFDAFVWQYRRTFTAALISLWRAWVAAGSPVPAKLAPWGSFEGWRDTVAAIVAYHGLGDVGESREDLVYANEQANANQELLQGLLEALAHWGENAHTPRGAKEIVNAWHSPKFERFRGAVETALTLKTHERPTALRLGHLLKKLRDRNVGGLAVTGYEDRHNKTITWSVRKVAG